MLCLAPVIETACRCLRICSLVPWTCCVSPSITALLVWSRIQRAGVETSVRPPVQQDWCIKIILLRHDTSQLQKCGTLDGTGWAASSGHLPQFAQQPAALADRFWCPVMTKSAFCGPWHGVARLMQTTCAHPVNLKRYDPGTIPSFCGWAGSRQCLMQPTNIQEAMEKS